MSICCREKISSLNQVCFSISMKPEDKVGGPYTKPEQEERRNQVFELHFQQSYSAVQTAKAKTLH